MRAEKQERWTGRVGYSGQKKQIACLRLAGRGIVRHDQHRYDWETWKPMIVEGRRVIQSQTLMGAAYYTPTV